MSSDNLLELVKESFFELHPFWLLPLSGFLIWGVIEMLCFAAFVPFYYEKAIPLRRLSFRVDFPFFQFSDRLQSVFKRHNIAYRDNNGRWLFRFPNLPVIQPFIVFGLISCIVREPGQCTGLRLEAKTYFLMPVGILALATGGFLDLSFQGQWRQGLEMATILVVTSIPLTFLPVVLLQRCMLKRMVRLLQMSLQIGTRFQGDTLQSK